jgi:predicted dehydrogenase/threonine dehydrogenase-like Zn-dependent dehydrogenase
MRQVARRLKDGALELVEVAEPIASAGHVLVEVSASVISAGTERATLEAAEKSLLAKARARPDQARQVIDRIRRDGARATIEFVRQRLDELGPLGYSAAGTVVEVGEAVSGLAPGDRVAIAGGGLANHAELDVVPHLLCARVPDGVSDEDAAFSTLGAIAMHGFRRAEIEVGSTVVVVGLGLVGQLATRIALAAGCTVHGVDVDERMIALARKAGAHAHLRAHAEAQLASKADATLICASTADEDPILLAAAVARDRAPMVVVGDVRMNIPRGPFFEKELDLRLSRSYGPGRYDPAYELHGRDYPEGYVRWTERRNLEAFLDLVAAGRIDPGELITHRFPIAEAKAAYEALRSERATAIVLTYPGLERPGPVEPAIPARRARTVARKPRFGLIGAGSFATGKIIPGLVAAGFEPARIASASGLSAESARQRFGFETAGAGTEAILDAADLDLVVVATPHALHAPLVAAALARDLPVYVEKPLALDWDGLAAVQHALAQSTAPLFVGFNRRFAPAAARLRELPGPRVMAYRINAGPLPADHWTNDLERGGGRLKGEGCHFVDFLCDQAGSDPLTVTAAGFASDPRLARAATDNFSIQIRFADGSVGTVNYAADAPNGPGKERFETSAPGAYGVIEDFRAATLWRGRSRESIGTRRQAKGFDAQFAAIGDVVRGRAEPPSPESYLISSIATLAAARSLESGMPETVIAQAPDPDAGAPLAEVSAAEPTR